MRSILVFACFLGLQVNGQRLQDGLLEVGIWDTFEISFANDRSYSDPFRDVDLLIQLEDPEGTEVAYWGFYDGNQTWKVRFMPNERGKWKYSARFTDRQEVQSGEFRCVESNIPGQVSKNTSNPFWLGFKGGTHALFRSLHVGDRFFAENWDDPNSDQDGNPREVFLDWVQGQGYNMLSIASHYLNRDAEGRGRGWATPELWPLNPAEFRKMEVILDELKRRQIVVFPFAGFFGNAAVWPVDYDDQELYIRYTLARIGHYWNTILSVAGPEPLWKKDTNQYQGAMRLADIKRLGQLVTRLEVHGKILTVHNEKRATRNGDPFLYEPWYDMSTLQGPTTLDRDELYSGLVMNHHASKPMYAQETLWHGNKWHPDYSDAQIRKNAFTILFAGGILNFADMNGNSSTGFSGSLDLKDRTQHRHDIVKRVWDVFDRIPFYRLVPRQDLIKGDGVCLAREGEEYFVYLDEGGTLELFANFPYPFHVRWINAAKPDDVREGEPLKDAANYVLQSPTDGDDWIVRVYTPRP